MMKNVPRPRKCKLCGAHIYMVLMDETQKWEPIDVFPDQSGTVVLRLHNWNSQLQKPEIRGRILHPDGRLLAGEELRTCHKFTCPRRRRR